MQVLKLNCGGKEKKYVSKPLGHGRTGWMPLLYLVKCTPFLGDKSFKTGTSESLSPPCTKVSVWNIFLPELNVYVYIERRVWCLTTLQTKLHIALLAKLGCKNSKLLCQEKSTTAAAPAEPAVPLAPTVVYKGIVGSETHYTQTQLLKLSALKCVLHDLT